MRTHDQQVQMSIQRIGAAVLVVLLTGSPGVVPEQAAPNADDLDGIRISVATPITTPQSGRPPPAGRARWGAGVTWVAWAM